MLFEVERIRVNKDINVKIDGKMNNIESNTIEKKDKAYDSYKDVECEENEERDVSNKSEENRECNVSDNRIKKRIKLIISYDGTNYCGWQIQINGITVEEIINRELSRLLGEEIAVIGASRTDSGVHALGNVAVFDTFSRIPPEKMCFALNQRLPEDIRIEDSCEVSPYFHPRYCNSTKTYEYKILNRRFDVPTMRLYTHFVYMPLDAQKMKQAAVSRFGSGWAWLLSDPNGILVIRQTANQDVPDLKVYTPIMLVDVWEHAYYLQYQNRRSEYVDGWFTLINWKKAGRRYEEAIAEKR